MNKLVFPIHRETATREELIEYIEELHQTIKEWGDAIGYAEGILFTDGLKNKELIEFIVDEGF